MKKISYVMAAVLFLSFASCGTLKKNAVDTLYNKHNREKVKVKKGLFSSSRAAFGDFTTNSMKDGVDKRIISFSKREQPFHFTLSEKETPLVKVQALYTDKASLSGKELPSSFYDAGITKVFYAWISGSTANNLNNWELLLKNPSYEELSKDAVIGALRSSNDIIDVHANDRSGHHNYDELTYEFQLRGIPVAAVQVNGRRKYVWMEPGLSPEVKYAIAGAISALLLK